MFLLARRVSKGFFASDFFIRYVLQGMLKNRNFKAREQGILIDPRPDCLVFLNFTKIQEDLQESAPQTIYLISHSDASNRLAVYV